MAHTASKKFTESAFFPLDIPQGVELGFNLMIFDIGPKFRGIGMLPKGLHFVYYSCGMGLRQGYFINFNSHEIILRSWNPDSESLSTTNLLSEGSTEEFMKSLFRGELNEFIGAYNVNDHHTWQNLSKFITCRVLEKCDCACFDSGRCNPSDFGSVTLYPGEDEDIEAELLKVMMKTEGSNGSEHSKFKNKYTATDNNLPQVPVFIDLIAQEKEYCASTISSSSRSPSQISSFHLDKTQFLVVLLKCEYDGSWEALLGELQLSFILFLNLYSAPSLKHWQRIINLVCGCEGFMRANAEFTACFIRLLFHQLNFAPYDFFMEEISKNNFLRGSLSNLMRSLQDTTGAGDVCEVDSDDSTQFFSGGSGDGKGSSTSSSQTVQECKRRLLVFLRKKFSIFEQDSDELGEFSDRLTALNRLGVQGQEAGGNSSRVNLSMDDMYSLDYDDLPVIVDADEYQRYEELQAAAIQESESGPSGTVAMDEQSVAVHPPAVQKWTEIDEKLAFLVHSASLTSPDSSSISAPAAATAAGATKTTQGPSQESTPVEVVTDSDHDRERAVFGWRYPLLCDELVHLSALRRAKLDLTMTARLVLDEYICAPTIPATELPSVPSAFQDDQSIKQSFLRRVREEAMFFLENECTVSRE